MICSYCKRSVSNYDFAVVDGEALPICMSCMNRYKESNFLGDVTLLKWIKK